MISLCEIVKSEFYKSLMTDKKNMYIYDGMVRDGLHLRIDNEGNMERVLSSNGDLTELPIVNLIDELLEVAEVNDKYYIIAVNYLNSLCDDFEKAIGTDDEIKLYNKFFESANMIIEGLIENNPVLGHLMELTIQMNWYLSYELTVQDRLKQIVGMFNNYIFISTELEFLLTDLSKGKELDFDERCSIFKYSEITKAYIHTKKGLEKEYYIQTVSEYYILLVNKFLDMNLSVQRCRCCGNFFVTKTKRKTLYCDRALFKNGKTCKDVAPKAMQKYLSKNDDIIKAYDKAKNKMYKRMQRACDFGKTKKSISYDEYSEWLSKAQQAKKDYLKGNLSADKALEIIKCD